MSTLRSPPTPHDHRRGAPDGAVVLVEYGDYQCPYCRAVEPTVEALLHNFPQDLQVIFRHFPLSQMHPMAEVAAQTAEFAAAYGAFWPMHEALFANQPLLSVPVIFAIAGRLSLDRDALEQALEAGTYEAKVRGDFIGGVRSGVNGTPCFFVDGRRHDGAHSFGDLSAAIAAARAAANSSHFLGAG